MNVISEYSKVNVSERVLDHLKNTQFYLKRKEFQIKLFRDATSHCHIGRSPKIWKHICAVMGNKHSNGLSEECKITEHLGKWIQKYLGKLAIHLCVDIVITHTGNLPHKYIKKFRETFTEGSSL